MKSRRIKGKLEDITQSKHSQEGCPCFLMENTLQSPWAGPCLIRQVEVHGAPMGSWTTGKAGTKIVQVEALTWISHLSSEQHTQQEYGDAAVQGAHRHPAGFQNIHSSLSSPQSTLEADRGPALVKNQAASQKCNKLILSVHFQQTGLCFSTSFSFPCTSLTAKYVQQQGKINNSQHQMGIFPGSFQWQLCIVLKSMRA